MNKIFYLTLFSFFFISKNEAQQIHRCHTDEYVNYLNDKNPGTKDNIRTLFDQAKNYASNRQALKSTASVEDTIFRIPVVFHVVYNDSSQNTPDSLLISQIRVLNEDFRRLNADTVNTRAIFKSRAADVGFEFFFATIDPEGNPTNGILRTFTNKTSFTGSLADVDEVKQTLNGGSNAWDTDKYLNIWICNTGGSLLGYAYPPAAAPNWTAGQTPADQTLWGVVISHQVIGYENPLATGALSIANKGRTGTHELGHYFGLRHVWGDAFSNCNLNRDDGIDDTPHMGSNSQASGCDFTKNTCTNGESPDEPDMPENYMDYSTESCQNLFTNGQTSIMRSMAVIGRPDLAEFICDETFSIDVGDWIVLNGTDTFFITDSTLIAINTGDQVIFLNENNGYTYTATGLFVLNSNTDVNVSEEGEIESVKDYTNIESVFSNNDFTIYPNPIKTTFKIQSDQMFNKVTIMNINGQLIKNIEKAINTKIEIGSLSNGIYLVSIYQNDILLSVKKISIVK